MSIHLPLPFHVFDELNRLQARTHTEEQALHLVATMADRAHVMRYRTTGTQLLWTKGSEEVQSLESAIATMRARGAKP